MSQILRRRLSAHSHGCRRLSSAVYGGGGGRRRAGAGAVQPPQDDEASRAVRVSVWWDFENCNIPNGVNVYRVAPRVSAALRAAGIRGPLSITAFGDVLQLARSSQEALAATGVSISHVPSSGKNSSDRSFMADLVYWIAQNPPPVHFFLISGDKDFANILHRLRMSNYNVLLACPSNATSVLCSAATIMWPWDGLVRGEDLSPKRFNHPPDGLHGSWYGHYRGALDDPSLEKESKEPIKVASDPKHFSVPSDTKPSPVPKYVTNAILEILRSYPEGMRISDLRVQLIKNRIDLGTDLFGHMKCSCLLESMPDVKLVGPPNGENEPYAIPVNKRLLQPGDRALDGPFLEKESEEPIKVPSESQHCSVPPDTKPSSVPKYVTNAILEVLPSYPEGINLSLLRGELKKKKICLGPDFFGHKKFSCLLQSIPDIVELVGLQTGQGYAIAVNRRLLQPGDGCTKTLSSAQCNVRENNPTGTAHTNKKHTLSSSQSIDRSRSFTETLSEHPPTFSVLPSPSNGLSEDQNECPVADVSGSTESPAKHREVDEMTTPGTPSSSGVENAANKDGFFKRIWTMWNGPENVKSEVSQNCESTSAEVIDDLQTPLEECNADRRTKLLRRIHKTSSKNDRSDGTESTAAVSDNLSISLGDDHSEKIKRDPSIPENPEPCRKPVAVSMSKSGKKDDISEMNRGLFNWASRWWTFGKSDADSSTTNVNAADEPKSDSIEEFESSNAPTYGSAQQVVHEIFTKPDLWAVLEQQLSEPLGSEVILKAKTREELAHELQKLNCWPLKGLLEKDLHHLVHLLISEKKWIEETSSRLFPFRLTLPHKRKCVPSSSSKSNGLSFIFSSGKPQKGKYVDDKSRKNKSFTREEILSDCHKLLKELLSESEYGFNIGIFKRRFTQKYGYELDHRKLGYPDLESLLQIMPDARVKFPRVMPSEHGNGQGGNKGNGNRSNGDDLIWEELGPVSATTETAAAGVNKEMCYCPPTPSDDEFSDSDSIKDQQPRRNAEQQSSLLQIIGSWNSSKSDGSSKKPLDIDGLVDCSRGGPGNLDSMTSGKAQTSSKLLHRQYSFVSDSGEDSEPDKLVESVLGSLQKARGSKLHN
ncbi:uncharacterized protein [Miscanthus floridulus]|uniref:uncharacterized protein n=1 Tax=Miscanthus floridulus TaxID=154761 RepID=UPI00345986B1